MKDYKIWNSDIGKIFIDRQNKEVGIDIEKQELEKPKLTREEFEEVGKNPAIDTKKFVEDYFKTHGTKDPFKQKKNIEKSDEYPSYSCAKCRDTFSDSANVKSIKDFHLCKKCMQDLDFKDQDAVQAEKEHFGKQKDYTTAKNVNINECDFCKQKGKSEKAIYDGKTKFGPWAGMCEEHFRENGIGLGLGKGQRLI